MIVDEPTAELDTDSASARARRRCGGIPRRDFVVATHDPDVLAIADHVIELERGRNAVERPPPPEPPRARTPGTSS